MAGRMLGLAMAGLLGLAATPFVAHIVRFGDSLVDSGNADAALRAQGQPTRTPASSGYFQNRFSNGYNFADVLLMNLGQGPSQAFGYPVTPFTYFYNGPNFSYGGAQTRDEGHGTPGHSPSFQDQLALFEASGKTIGAHDYMRRAPLFRSHPPDRAGEAGAQQRPAGAPASAPQTRRVVSMNVLLEKRPHRIGRSMDRPAPRWRHRGGYAVHGPIRSDAATGVASLCETLTVHLTGFPDTGDAVWGLR